jgi:enolase-phosphatase E1
VFRAGVRVGIRADERVITEAPTPSVQAILLDIEGTTTPIAFVAEVLFPYARRHLREYLDQHASLGDDDALFDQFRKEWELDRDKGAPAWVDVPSASRLESVAAYSDWLMDRDRKSTALKTLQGRIWEQGYARGELVGEVFADVPPALERWRGRGIRIGIFSSGSVLAQKLLFRHSLAGDLTAPLQWYFDTTTGAKADRESYHRIAAIMAIPPGAILFVSDVVRELDAARSAGMRTALSIRRGNESPPDQSHAMIRSFDELDEMIGQPRRSR